MRLFYLILFALFYIPALFCQDFQAKDIQYFTGEHNSHEWFHVDQNENRYIAGKGTGAIDFEFGSELNTLPADSDNDLYLAKYNDMYHLDWLLSFDGTQSSQIQRVETDSEGNVYVTGSFQGSLQLTADGMNAIDSPNSISVFEVKFDEEGNLVWKHTIGDADNTQTVTETYISNLMLFVHISYSGNFDVDPGVGEEILNGNNSNALILYDLDGGFVRSYEHNGQTEVITSMTDNEGNIYMTGSFSGLVSLDYKSNFSIISSGISDAFIVKYDSEFNLLWYKTIGKSLKETRISQMDLDSNNDVVLIGKFSEEVTIGSFLTDQDANYVVNISKEGDYQEVFHILDQNASIYDLSLNSLDQVIITAGFDEIMDVDPSEAVLEITPQAGGNKLLAVYSADYELVGADQIHAPFIETYSLHIHPDDKITILTDFQGEGKVLFGDQNMHTASGDQQNFISYTLDIDGCTSTSDSFNIESCDFAQINDVIYTESGEYVQYLTNAEGCDSILTLNLSIYFTMESVQFHEACNTFEINDEVFEESGYYTFELISQHGCDSIVNIDLTLVSINEDFEINGSLIRFLEEDADQYQWYDCATNMPIEGETSNTFLPSQDGSYQIEIIKDFCTTVSECIDFILLDIEDVSAEVKIAPNPAHEMLFIETKIDRQGIKVMMMDMTGKVALPLTQFNPNESIDISQIDPGIYLLRLESEDQIAHKKIIVY